MPIKRRERKIARLEEKLSKETPKDERRYKRAEKRIVKGGPEAEKKYGYNYKAAEAQGIGPDETGHWPSVGEGGEILKGSKHPTYYKTKKMERALGNKIVKRDGKRYTIPRKSNVNIRLK